MFKATHQSVKTLIQAQKFSRSVLKQRLHEVFPKKIAQFRDFRRKYGEFQIGSLTVNDVLDGNVSAPILYYEGSVMDPKTVFFSKKFPK